MKLTTAVCLLWHLFQMLQMAALAQRLSPVHTSVTDACLNQILVTQTITVDDNINPTASNPAPVTVQCIGDVPAADITVVTDEADNCGVPVVAFVSDVSMAALAQRL